MNAALTADVIDNPLKKSKKGIEPPSNPINERFSHCFFVNFFIKLNSFRKTKPPKTNAKTAKFFKKVKIYGFMPLTPNLFTKTEKPLITAVKNINTSPFL